MAIILLLAAGLLLTVLQAAGAQNKSPSGTASATEPGQDSSAVQARSGVGLAARDSAFVMQKKHQALDYVAGRERFNYPHTRRKDPFDCPMGQANTGAKSGPSIFNLELSGVLYSPAGPRIAILVERGGVQSNNNDQHSIILREGDQLGLPKSS